MHVTLCVRMKTLVEQDFNVEKVGIKVLRLKFDLQCEVVFGILTLPVLVSRLL